MARTPTNQIPLGFKAIEFNLPDVITGEKVSLNQVSKKNGLVVIFICNHCPYVIHVIDQIVKLAKDYLDKEIGFVAISSNDVVNYPDDDPKKMKLFAKEKDFPFPYLYDESQDIAKLYDAACTPDYSVFNSELNCVYRGQLDDSRPSNNESVNGKDLRLVLDYILENKKIDFIQKPSIGCNIKWK
jgi:peroxiredoxin